ncbi:MAG TPA: hypothetical protein VE956_03250 [Nodularia sp. (in: cyanobacteria)]|nr:hypothetical protein [Nodularia sp. (in: cyanobacteria)]
MDETLELSDISVSQSKTQREYCTLAKFSALSQKKFGEKSFISLLFAVFFLDYFISLSTQHESEIQNLR